MSTVLHLDDVSLRLGDGDQEVTALDHVNLSVDAGEFVAVLGPSGSGKSSLLAVAGALLQPSEGTVSVADTELTLVGAPERTRVRLHDIGFVFQGSNLVPSLRAVEQLQLMVHLDGGNVRKARSRALELLDEVGMSARADRRPNQLSGGERQRVGIARALMNDPVLLLVDEPTSALDNQRGKEIVDLLARETHRRGVACVMVTHDTELLSAVDRTVTMSDGRLRD